MDTFLVTGGAGFIGSHLVSALVARGDRVRVLDDLSSGSLDNLRHLSMGELGSARPVEFLQASLADSSAIERAVTGVRGVFHQAAQVSVPASFDDPVASYGVNVLGTLRLLEAMRARSVDRIVFAASSAAYGDDPQQPKREDSQLRPLSPYASGKIAGETLLELWAARYGMHCVSLRYFNVYGPRQSDSSPYSGVIALFIRRMLAGQGVWIFGDGSQTRDFVFVDDVVRANLAAMSHTQGGALVLNVGTGQALSILELFRELAGLTGYSQVPRLGPPREGDVPHSLASIERARATLGFVAQTERQAGLAQTVAWYRQKLAPAEAAQRC